MFTTGDFRQFSVSGAPPIPSSAWQCLVELPFVLLCSVPSENLCVMKPTLARQVTVMNLRLRGPQLSLPRVRQAWHAVNPHEPSNRLAKSVNRHPVDPSFLAPATARKLPSMVTTFFVFVIRQLRYITREQKPPPVSCTGVL